jgi:maltoporin
MLTTRLPVFAVLTTAMSFAVSTTARAQDEAVPGKVNESTSSSGKEGDPGRSDGPEAAGHPSEASAASPSAPSAKAALAPVSARGLSEPETSGRFEFGSYGRVGVASDLRGGTGRPADVVAHGSRLDEESYSEFELRREDTWKDGIKTRIVTTLALFPPFFHYSGKPGQNIGVRNLYVQGAYKDLTLWGGSRMYRGDDIYLLNWWPLDNQNTVGAGGIYQLPSDTTVALHAGMQRLDNDNQYQQIPAVVPYGFGYTNVTFLDRPRTIETLKVTKFYRNNQDKRPFASDRAGMKAIVYGEAHQIAAGVRRETDPQYDRPLPSDTGFLVGTQLSYWTGDRDTYVSLFARYARGLAAYDPLANPLTFSNERTTSGAQETQFALAGNWEKDWFGIMAAGYLRFFRDGSPAPSSREKYDEGALIARPQVYLGEHWGVGLEGSFQQRRYGFVDASKDENVKASLLRAAINPYFSPAGRGSFKRPQLGLVYMITSRDQGARSLYASEDVFSRRKAEHFFGLLAEWWFNFSSYP